MRDELGWLRGGSADGRTPAEPELLADIHATVDLERALADAGLEPSRAGAGATDEVLGARVVLIDAGGGSTIALAEPSTEGRLARTLAQHGEGIAGRYVRSSVSLAETAGLAAAAGLAVSRPASGPFGQEMLLLGGSRAGPHVLLVEPRTVPSGR